MLSARSDIKSSRKDLPIRLNLAELYIKSFLWYFGWEQFKIVHMEQEVVDTKTQNDQEKNEVIELFEALLVEPIRMQAIVNKGKGSFDVTGMDDITHVVSALHRQIIEGIVSYTKNNKLREKRAALNHFVFFREKIEKIFSPAHIREIEEVLK